MSRSGYSEDCENISLWRGAVNRAIGGKRGQAFLRELVEALDALPEPRLVSDVLVDGSDCCAIGAVALKRGMDVGGINYEYRASVGSAFGIAGAMAAEIAFENDEQVRHETPEEKWKRMRKWAVDNLRTSA